MTSMTLLQVIYLLIFVLVALTVGFVVSVVEHRKLWKKYEKLQERCWGLQEEIMEGEDNNANVENDDDNENEKDKINETHYH